VSGAARPLAILVPQKNMFWKQRCSPPSKLCGLGACRRSTLSEQVCRQHCMRTGPG
jgi:hypothetical protein